MTRSRRHPLRKHLVDGLGPESHPARRVDHRPDEAGANPTAHSLAADAESLAGFSRG